MNMISFNLNSDVWVKIEEAGLRHLAGLEHIDNYAYIKQFTRAFEIGAYVKMQMIDFIRLFGLAQDGGFHRYVSLTVMFDGNDMKPADVQALMLYNELLGVEDRD